MSNKTKEQAIEEFKKSIEKIDISTKKGIEIKKLYNELLKEIEDPFSSTIEDILLKGFRTSCIISKILMIASKPIPKYKKGGIAMIDQSAESELILTPKGKKLLIPNLKPSNFTSNIPNIGIGKEFEKGKEDKL